MLEIALNVTPVRVSADGDLGIQGSVRNLGSSVADTEIWASKLLVNGSPSESWSWSIANGLRDEREFALPPGEKVEFQRTFSAASILPEPGRYELVLEVQGVASPPVAVERS